MLERRFLSRAMSGSFTFTKTRRVVGRVLKRDRVQAVLWLVFLGTAFLSFAALRGKMDDFGFPVHSREIETLPSGWLPTLWLQQRLLPLSPGLFAWAVAVVYAAAVAGAVAVAAKLDYRAVLNWTRSRARETMVAGQRLPEPASASRARLHHRERAQALLEFVFVLPFIFVILFSIVDFGIAVDRRLVLQHAAREGARYGAVHATASIATTISDIQQRTVAQAQDVINTSNVSVCYIDKNSNSSPGDAGDAVRVSVTNYTWRFPILSEMASAFGFGPLSIDLKPSATARLEQSVPGATACP